MSHNQIQVKHRRQVTGDEKKATADNQLGTDNTIQVNLNTGSRKFSNKDNQEVIREYLVKRIKHAYDSAGSKGHDGIPVM
jgi:hypothetical protein